MRRILLVTLALLMMAGLGLFLGQGGVRDGPHDVAGEAATSASTATSTPPTSQASTLSQTDFYDRMRAPVVQIETVFAIWSVVIKPEYQGDFWYSGPISTYEGVVEVKAGQEWVGIELPDQYTPLPDIWVENHDIWCGLVYNAPQKEIGEPARYERCTSDWKIGTSFQMDRPDDLSVKNHGYLIHINPLDKAQLVKVSVPVYKRLSVPFRYSLDRMYRGKDENKVIEKIDLAAIAGTGAIIYTGPTALREQLHRWNDGTTSVTREWTTSAYDTQTLILTNEHMVQPIYSDAQYVYKKGDSIIATWAIVAGQGFVKLNPEGKPIPVDLAVWDDDKDLAILYKSPALPHPPILQWLKQGQALPQPGETIWVVGHPLGLPDDTIEEGRLDSTMHRPQPGVPRWGRVRYLATVPARGGNSGSPAFVERDGEPVAIGVLHAGWGSIAGMATPPWVSAMEESIGLDDSLNVSRLTISLPGFKPDISGLRLDPSAVRPESVFIPSDMNIIITLDDVAAFLTESSVDLPVTSWYTYLGRD